MNIEITEVIVRFKCEAEDFEISTLPESGYMIYGPLVEPGGVRVFAKDSFDEPMDCSGISQALANLLEKIRISKSKQK